MKALLLSGGHGTRLYPLTKVINKHGLPIYDKPLIYYPIIALRDAGITDITISLGEHEPGRFFELLGNGEELGVDLSWHYHGEAKGIAYAINSAHKKIGDDPFVVLLGDNIFCDGIGELVDAYKRSSSKSMIVLQRKDLDELRRFGVAKLAGFNVESVVEKPEHPPSEWAVLGLYFLNKYFFDLYEELSPSKRGEYEITDALTLIAENYGLNWMPYEGRWLDVGTHEDRLNASIYMRDREKYMEDK